MKAVIMAGGKGTRLSSVLKDIPKPMVPIAGKPLLEHQIENLEENGIKEIILVVGHLGQVIQEHFKDGAEFGVKISYYVEKEPLGTAGALFFLKSQLRDNFILLFGDVFVDINFKKLMKYHEEKEGIATLYVHPNSHPYDSDLVVTDNNGRVTGWLYKNLRRTEDYKNQVNAGIYIFSPRILDRLEENKKIDLEKDIISKYLEEESIYAYCCSEYVKDIGTPERLARVESDYIKGVCRQRNLKNRQKCIFLDRDGTINKHVGFLSNPVEFCLEASVSEAIKKINQSEYLAIVISNQPVISRGECSFNDMDKIHNRMYTLLGEEGCFVDGLYYCPHHPDKGFEGEVKELKIKCKCRKPNVGMIEAAAETFNIDLRQSWIVGDTTVDIQTGKNAGLKTCMVMTGEKGQDKKYDVIPDMEGESLLLCVEEILKKEVQKI